MYTGLDLLRASKFRSLNSANVGLCTNISSCDSRLKPTISLFSEQGRFRLAAVFAPEHGLFGALQDQVKAGDFYDKSRKVKIFSLYKDNLVPDNDVLRKIDVLVIDLQDIGSRFYTFLWSAVLMIEQMARLGKKIYILDRPNPLNGKTVQGPVLEPEFVSFVGLYSIPVRHGMTIAELCSMINEELRIGAEIDILKMRGWLRRHYFADTGLPWTVPSPNMPSFETALVYPGMCLLEGTNVSEGRGTTKPFEIFGAPWIDPFAFVKAAQKCKIPGARFRPTFFIPTFNKYRDKLCGGAQIYVTNKERFNPVVAGLEIITIISSMYPDRFRWRKPPYEFERHRLPFDILVGSDWIREAIGRHRSIASIRKRWQASLRNFKKKRKKYLLYG